MKKVVTLILTIIILISCPTAVHAAQQPEFSGIYAYLPTFNFELRNVKKDECDSISAKLSGHKLKINNVSKYDDEKHTKHVIMLVDVSTSMNQEKIDSLKPVISSYASSFKKEDKFELITFGDKVNEPLLKGGENKSEIQKKVNSIKCDSEGTTFYKALNEVFEKKTSNYGQYDRQYIIVISDGADFNKGSSSCEEVENNFRYHLIPVYGMCQYDTTKDAADGFNYICKLSGGKYYSFSNNNAEKQFENLIDYINDIVFVQAETDSNILSGGEEAFAVTVGNRNTSMNLELLKSKKDEVSPQIEKIEYSKEKNAFVISFSEPVKNADVLTSYEIKSGNETCPLKKAELTPDNKSAVIYPEKTVYSGNYMFILNDITDLSQEENPLDANELTVNIKATPIIFKYIKVLLWVFIPIIVACIVLIVLFAVKKKKKVKKIKDVFETQVEEVVENKHVNVVKQHIKTPKGKKICLYVELPGGITKSIECNVESSAIVGRSNICDVYLDDPKMSRQHFVIELDNDCFTVADLETTNGTFLNGYRLVNRQILKPGDKITAGTTAIIVDYKK